MPAACPICGTEAREKFRATPYWICPNCDCWFQWPQPPKVWHGPHEGDPRAMGDEERLANKQLAGALFERIMQRKPGRTFDIGAALPVLASELQTLGCDAIASDPERIDHSLPVETIVLDFERDEVALSGFALVTLIHTFEHLYDPVAAIRKLRRLVADDGALFIRSPDHSVRGFERDLTDGHYTIHPFYHSRSSLLQCLLEAGDCFALTESLPTEGYGQMDCTLRPL